MNRLRVVAAIAAVAVLALVAAPADAVSFGGATRVSPNDCGYTRTVTKQGVTRGWTVCSEKLRYIQGSGSSFTTSPVSYNGMPLAVADDGATSYLILATSRTLRLIKRSHGGSTTNIKLSGENNVADAGLAARDGKWWAVWSESDDVTCCTGDYGLYEARTIGGTHSRHRIFHDGFSNIMVSLANRPGGGVMLAWRHEGSLTYGQLYVGVNRGSGWHFQNHADSGNYPTLLQAGRSIRLAYVFGAREACGRGYCKVVYQRWQRGRWGTKHKFTHPYVSPISGSLVPLLAVSKGNAFVAWSALRSDGHRTKGIVGELTSGHGWAESNISAPGTDEEVAGLGAVTGLGQVILVHNTDTTKYLVLRRQT